MGKVNETCGNLMNNLEKYILENENKELPAYIEKVIDEMQQEAFMAGYQYAIEVLNESMVKKDV